jgi:hypothetical protein
MTTGPQSPEEPEPGRTPSSETPASEPAPPPPPAAGHEPAPPPPGWGQAPQAPTSGYGVMPMSQSEEKLWAIIAQLGPLIGLSFVVPLIVWLVFKDRSEFVDRQAKEALNMQISYFIYFAVSALSLLLLIGIILLPVVGIAWLVFMIIAAVKNGAYEDYRYPLIFRFVS